MREVKRHKGVDGKVRYEAHVIAALDFRYRDRQMADRRADQPKAERIKKNRDTEKHENQSC